MDHVAFLTDISVIVLLIWYLNTVAKDKQSESVDVPLYKYIYTHMCKCIFIYPYIDTYLKKNTQEVQPN